MALTKVTYPMIETPMPSFTVSGVSISVLDSATGKLSYKDSGGVVNALY